MASEPLPTEMALGSEAGYSRTTGERWTPRQARPPLPPLRHQLRQGETYDSGYPIIADRMAGGSYRMTADRASASVPGRTVGDPLTGLPYRMTTDRTAGSDNYTGLAPSAVGKGGIVAGYALNNAEREKLALVRNDMADLQPLQSRIDALKSTGRLTSDQRDQLNTLKDDAASLADKLRRDRKAFKSKEEKATLSKYDIEEDLRNHGFGSLGEWYKDVHGATFLGILIVHGIHNELASRLKKAETQLMEQTGIKDPAALAKQLGLKTVSGLRAPAPAKGGTEPSLHSYGLAVDINYRGCPFIGHVEAHAQLPDERVVTTSRAISRALLLVRQQKIDLLDPHQVREDVGEQYDFLRGASDALAKYFTLQSEASAPELIFLAHKLQQSGTDARDANAWREQIRSDYAGLAGKGDFESHLDPAEGFLDLDKRLVIALTRAGLYWGGQYKAGKDIMHFDYRDGTITRKPYKRLEH